MGPPVGMPRNLGDLLARPGEGARIALIDLAAAGGPVELSAATLADHVRAFARGVAKLGIEPGERIGILSRNRWEALVSYLGTLCRGAIAVPINYKFPPQTIEHIARDAEVTLLLCEDSLAGRAPQGLRRIGLDDGGPGGFRATLDPGPVIAFDPGERHLAEILYTSGSTGTPKGVPLDHAGQLWALGNYLEPVAGEEAPERSLIVAPLYHMNALFNASVCLLNAITIVMLPRFDAAAYLEAVLRYRCSRLSGVPTMFAMLAALEKARSGPPLDFVTAVSVGSAPLSAALLESMEALFPAAEITNGYGTTEAGPAVFGAHPEGKPRPRLSLGYPLEDVQWRLRDGSPHEAAMLELKTPALAAGYLNRPEADRERFEDGWFRTNDLMRRDADGFFFFVARADDMFVCGGENVYPGEVEALLDRHPAVGQSLVVGAPDDVKGTVPVAFVVPAPGAAPSEEQIRSFCLERGPAYAHPRRVVFKRSLPVGGTHKIDRHALEREAAALMVAAGRASAG